MSQVNKSHSVLFPPLIYLTSIRNRVQFPNVSLARTIVLPRLDYLATRRTELLWFSTSKSLVWLSNVDVGGTQNISTWQRNKLHDSCVFKFLSPTNIPLYYTYKMLKYTVKISHDCSYMFHQHGTLINEQHLTDINPLYKIADTSRIPIHAP